MPFSDKHKKRDYLRQWRASNPHKTRQYSREALERARAVIWKAKACGCVDCGFLPKDNFDYSALDFDHRPGEIKLFNISRVPGNKTDERLLAEIAKCDVRCSNCHRRITEMRRLKTPITG